MPFQSAPPVKGATYSPMDTKLRPKVSIRAPREGGDGLPDISMIPYDVSIRAPREGGDPLKSQYAKGPNGFNPRPP